MSTTRHRCLVTQDGELGMRNRVHVLYQFFEAFAVLMANQRLLCLPKLPNLLCEKTKDKVCNDLICLVDGMGLKWQSGEVNSGKSFLITLSNVLWYIDGHHESLASRGYEISQEDRVI